MRYPRRLLLLATIALTGALALGGVAHAATRPAKPATHAAEECIKILEGGGTIDQCQQAPSPLTPEIPELIWGVIFFAVVAFVLGRFAFPALKQAMEAREERIRADLERAEHARTEAEESAAGHQHQLADARNEAGRIIDEARAAADQVRRDIIARAEADATELRARADEDVRLATERAMADLQHRVGELSIELAEKIVERNLDRDTQMALVESYIQQVGSN